METIIYNVASFYCSIFSKPVTTWEMDNFVRFSILFWDLIWLYFVLQPTYVLTRPVRTEARAQTCWVTILANVPEDSPGRTARPVSVVYDSVFHASIEPRALVVLCYHLRWLLYRNELWNYTLQHSHSPLIVWFKDRARSASVPNSSGLTFWI